MATHICLPDLRLIKEIVEYRFACEPIPPQPFFASSTLALNIGGAAITLDGRTNSYPCLFCISSEPAMRIMEKSEGEVILVEVRVGGLFRMFGFDGVQFGGQIVEATPGNFPSLDVIFAAGHAAPNTLAGRVAALDEALLLLANIARPYGIGEKFQFIADLTKGNIRVEDAAERLGVTTRTLERDCRRRFGRTPKRILRGTRISYAMAPARPGGGPVKWSATDPGANFSDQPHFLREHKALGGMNPTQMHEALRDLNNQAILHSRSDVSVCGDPSDPVLAAEYEHNANYRFFNSKVAQELGFDE